MHVRSPFVEFHWSATSMRSSGTARKSQAKTASFQAGGRRMHRRRPCLLSVSVSTLPRSPVAAGLPLSVSAPRGALLPSQPSSPSPPVLQALARLHSQRHRAALRLRALLRRECGRLVPATHLASQAMMCSHWVALFLVPLPSELCLFRPPPTAVSPQPRHRWRPRFLWSFPTNGPLPPPCSL